MAIPFVDLKWQSREIEPELLEAFPKVLRSGRYILGPELELFEEEARRYLGTKHAVGVASGTEALFLSLQALDLRPSDEVITTPLSFIAGAAMILAFGAIPVFSDIDPKTFNLDPSLVEGKITPRTKGVLIVHLFGVPAEMRTFEAICKKRRLFLIEDCAQAFGARSAGRSVGTFGDVGCYSFYPTKNLGGMGDGGMVVTDRDDLAAKLKSLRNHGSSDGGEPHLLGWNSRLDDLQAAILRIKLKHLDPWTERRRELARCYHRHLEGSAVIPQKIPSEAEATYSVYTVRTKNRDRVRETLNAQGVETMIYYPKPLYRLPAVVKPLPPPPPSLPRVEEICREVLSLPLYPGLDESQVDQICQIIRDAEKH